MLKKCMFFIFATLGLTQKTMDLTFTLENSAVKTALKTASNPQSRHPIQIIDSEHDNCIHLLKK